MFPDAPTEMEGHWLILAKAEDYKRSTYRSMKYLFKGIYRNNQQFNELAEE